MSEIELNNYRKSLLEGGLNNKIEGYIKSLRSNDVLVRKSAIQELCVGWGYCITGVPELLPLMKEVFEEMISNDSKLKTANVEEYLPNNFRPNDPLLSKKSDVFLSLFTKGVTNLNLKTGNSSKE